jgi:hypothetical protein
MKEPLIPKPVMILLGIVVLVLVVIVAVKLVDFLIDMFDYNFMYSAGFLVFIQNLAYAIVNFILCFMGIGATLAFIVPTWTGRKLYRTGYSLSDEETVLKVYRAAGGNMIIGCVLSIAVYVWWFIDYDFYSHDVLLPVGLIICGIIGMIAGISRKA